ncbi:membrane-bound transcription factor site-1 protease, partial [Caerostris darwini]
VASESWLLSDGTRIQKKCHFVNRCRQLVFPFTNDILTPDITEVRCNIEVHEQTQFNDDSSEEYFNVNDDNELEINFYGEKVSPYSEFKEGGEIFIASSENEYLELYFDLNMEYKFNRIAGCHVEVHFTVVVDNEDSENNCLRLQFKDILNSYLNDHRKICNADKNDV